METLLKDLAGKGRRYPQLRYLSQLVGVGFGRYLRLGKLIHSTNTVLDTVVKTGDRVMKKSKRKFLLESSHFNGRGHRKEA